MYILYENEFNENVHSEQDKLLRWINEASRLNPDVSLEVLLSAAKNWVDGKKYSITTLSGYNPAHPESINSGEEVAEVVVSEPEVVEVIVEDTTKINELEETISSLQKSVRELEDKNTALENELIAAYTAAKVAENVSEVEAETEAVEEVHEIVEELDAELEEAPVAVLPPHITHSVSQEDAIVELDDYVSEGDNIEASLTEKEIVEGNEITDAEVEESIEEVVEEEHAEAELDYFQALENEGPKRSINDTVDFSKRKRGRKGSALAALSNDGEDIENMETPDGDAPRGRPDRAKRRPKSFNISDEKQSRIRDNLVAIYSDPDALKDL